MSSFATSNDILLTDIKNIVFDFGTVLIAWDPEKVLRDYLNTREEIDFFKREVCNYKWARSIDRGLSYDEAIRDKIKDFPQYADAIRAYRERFLEMCPHETYGMYEIVRSLKEQGYNIYGLSNWDSETWPRIAEKFPVLSLIPDRVISGYEGYIKPEREIYEILLTRYNLEPKETLFIDDINENLSAAKKLGLRTYQFTNANRFSNSLHEMKSITHLKPIADLYKTYRERVSANLKANAECSEMKMNIDDIAETGLKDIIIECISVTMYNEPEKWNHVLEKLGVIDCISSSEIEKKWQILRKEMEELA